MGEYQDKVKKLYEDRGYTDDLLTLGLGLCEEAGEVAKAINQTNPKYKWDHGKIPYMLREELHDCLVYICAIANSAGIKLGI
jgi:NTP pyrophosphatase (non-canonical NTP hydrolase)